MLPYGNVPWGYNPAQAETHKSRRIKAYKASKGDKKHRHTDKSKKVHTCANCGTVTPAKQSHSGPNPTVSPPAALPQRATMPTSSSAGAHTSPPAVQLEPPATSPVATVHFANWMNYIYRQYTTLNHRGLMDAQKHDMFMSLALREFQDRFSLTTALPSKAVQIVQVTPARSPAASTQATATVTPATTARQEAPKIDYMAQSSDPLAAFWGPYYDSSSPAPIASDNESESDSKSDSASDSDSSSDHSSASDSTSTQSTGGTPDQPEDAPDAPDTVTSDSDDQDHAEDHQDHGDPESEPSDHCDYYNDDNEVDYDSAGEYSD